MGYYKNDNTRYIYTHTIMSFKLLYDISLVIGLYNIGYYLGFITTWVYNWYISIKCYSDQSKPDPTHCDDSKYIIQKSKVDGGFVYEIRMFGLLVVDIRKQNVTNEQHKLKFY
jgi:hypothetical protein